MLCIDTSIYFIYLYEVDTVQLCTITPQYTLSICTQRPEVPCTDKDVAAVCVAAVLHGEGDSRGSISPFYDCIDDHIDVIQKLTVSQDWDNKVFRLLKTLFIQGFRFYCTGPLLVGVIPSTNSEPVQ